MCKVPSLQENAIGEALLRTKCAVCGAVSGGMQSPSALFPRLQCKAKVRVPGMSNRRTRSVRSAVAHSNAYDVMFLDRKTKPLPTEDCGKFKATPRSLSVWGSQQSAVGRVLSPIATGESHQGLCQECGQLGHGIFSCPSLWNTAADIVARLNSSPAVTPANRGNSCCSFHPMATRGSGPAEVQYKKVNVLK